MKFSNLTAQKHGIPCEVSLNTIMVDGTGMCGACRLTIGGKTKFVCIDGPEFDGALVDWDEMFKRMATFKDAEREEMEHYAGDDRKRHVTIATGRLAADWMRQMCRIITEKFPNVTADVIPIRNDFFGEMITVSGLITGTDLIAQLKGRDLGDAVLIPCNMLRSGENVFLDDITVEQVILELKTSVEVVDREGKDLCLAVLGEKRSVSHKRRQMYEQTDSSNCGPS
jgi:hypothetical protein